MHFSAFLITVLVFTDVSTCTSLLPESFLCSFLMAFFYLDKSSFMYCVVLSLRYTMSTLSKFKMFLNISRD